MSLLDSLFIEISDAINADDYERALDLLDSPHAGHIVSVDFLRRQIRATIERQRNDQ